MSSRRSTTVKAQRPKRGQRAKSSREAASRWGFCGQASRLGAFTAEHLAADAAAGVVNIPARHCPASTVQGCRPDAVPLHFRSTRSTTIIDDDGPRPRRWRAQERTLCFDCRVWLWWRERREFADDFGDETGPLGYARFGTIADAGEVDRALAAQHRIDQAAINAAGKLDEGSLEWFETRILAASIRHCLGRWLAVTSPPSARG